ncbi:MAG: VOC family protein [Ferruginibacter sp.]
MKRYLKISLISVGLFLSRNYLFAQVKKVGPIGITVKDMDRSVKFYCEVLGFIKISDNEYTGDNYDKLQNIFGLNIRVVKMKLGDEEIELTDYLTVGGRSIPEDAKSNDLIFQHIAIVVSDMDKAYRRLKKFNIRQVSTAPQTLPHSNLAAAGIRAFYFHDVDDHNLELIFFPKGKGLQKWQQKTNRLFLGIDHTAIGVSNTDKSLDFYRGILGLSRKGESWNMGTEQAHLNFVEEASLRITGLRADSGPGIEFLEYIKPGPGKSFPEGSRTDDIWHWQTILLVDDVEALYNELKSAGYTIISKELVHFSRKAGRQSKAFIVRDGDGHAMLCVEEENSNKH